MKGDGSSQPRVNPGFQRGPLDAVCVLDMNECKETVELLSKIEMGQDRLRATETRDNQEVDASCYSRNNDA